MLSDLRPTECTAVEASGDQLNTPRDRKSRFPLTNSIAQVSYSLQDISYDVQQSFLSTVGDRKQRQKSGKVF